MFGVSYLLLSEWRVPCRCVCEFVHKLLDVSDASRRLTCVHTRDVHTRDARKARTRNVGLGVTQSQTLPVMAGPEVCSEEQCIFVSHDTGCGVMVTSCSSNMGPERIAWGSFLYVFFASRCNPSRRTFSFLVQPLTAGTGVGRAS